MPKRIYIINFDSSIVKSDADIPAQADMTAGAGYVDCSNIKLSSVKALLGEDSFALAHVCTSPLINKWAAFRPGSWNNNGNAGSDWLPSLCTTNPTYVIMLPVNNYRLGDFAGYNHTEDKKPTYWTSPPSSLTKEIGESATLSFHLAKGASLPVPALYNSTGWNYVKIQYWKNTGSGYSLDATSAVIDFNTMPVTKDLAAQAAGTSWSICVRPVYTDQYSGNAIGVIEDGVKTVTINWIALQFSSSQNSAPNTYQSGGYTYFEMNIRIVRTMASAKTIYVRYYIYDISGEIIPAYFVANPNTQYFSGLNDYADFGGTISAKAQSVTTNDAYIQVQVSIDNVNFTAIGTYGPYTVYY